MSSTITEVSWVLHNLKDLKVHHPQPAIIYTDSRATYCTFHNHVLHKKTKHIQNNYHYTREKIKEGVIKIIQIPIDENLVDVLTKPQVTSMFLTFNEIDNTV